MSMTDKRLMNSWARFRSELKQLQQRPTNFLKFGFLAPSVPLGRMKQERTGTRARTHSVNCIERGHVRLPPSLPPSLTHSLAYPMMTTNSSVRMKGLLSRFRPKNSVTCPKKWPKSMWISSPVCTSEVEPSVQYIDKEKDRQTDNIYIYIYIYRERERSPEQA